jgi:hypothetical protein
MFDLFDLDAVPVSMETDLETQRLIIGQVRRAIRRSLDGPSASKAPRDLMEDVLSKSLCEQERWVSDREYPVTLQSGSKIGNRRGNAHLQTDGWRRTPNLQ